MLPRGATQVVFRAIVLSGARDLHGRVRGHIFVLDPPGVGGGLPIKKSLDSASFGGLKIRSESVEPRAVRTSTVLATWTRSDHGQKIVREQGVCIRFH